MQACVSTQDDCCQIQWPVNVKKCHTNEEDYFYVYQLQPPPGCPMAYCFGKPFFLTLLQSIAREIILLP